MEDNLNKRKEQHEDIKEIVNSNPIQFIMYVGGAGGEFLSILISKYSKKYQHIPAIKQGYNRWISSHSRLMNYFCSHASLFNPDLIDNLDTIINRIIDHIENEGGNIDDIIYNADSTFKSHNNITLSRVHLSDNNFFTKENTFLLYLDSKWLRYAGILMHLKSNSEKLRKFEFHFNSKVEQFKHSHSNNSMNEMIEFLKTADDIEFVTVGHLEIVKESKAVTGELDMNVFLRLSSAELFNQYNRITFKYYSKPWNFLDWEDKIAKRVNVIDYDKIFTKGYLEEIFDIQGDEFHNELIQWHEDNLALIKDAGIDL